MSSFLTALGTTSAWTDTGEVFSTSIRGRNARWKLWVAGRQLNSKSDRGPAVKYLWSARDPNPGAVHTKDMKLEDGYNPPVGSTVEESKSLIAAWAKQFELPTPEQQGANLYQMLQQVGKPAPSYDPVITTVQPPVKKSKLPLIIGGAALVAVIAVIWWKFRK